MMVPSPLTSDGGVVNTARIVTNADSIVGLVQAAMRPEASAARKKTNAEQNRTDRRGAIPSD
jgi:hypothetical protein